MSTDRYTSPLSERYASKEMQYIFSQDRNLPHGENSGLHLQRQRWSLGLSRMASRLSHRNRSMN